MAPGLQFPTETMRNLALLFLFLAIPLASGSLRPKAAVEFWKDSGADVALASRVLNERECLSGPKFFKACRNAILRGAELLERSDILKDLRGMEFRSDFSFSQSLRDLTEGQSIEPWIIGEMINAQLRVLDSHASILPRALFRQRMDGASNSYFSSGIEAEANGAGLFVFRILPNSAPSQRFSQT